MAKCEMIVAPLQAAATTASQPPALINIFPGGGRAPPPPDFPPVACSRGCPGCVVGLAAAAAGRTEQGTGSSGAAGVGRTCVDGCHWGLVKNSRECTKIWHVGHRGFPARVVCWRWVFVRVDVQRSPPWVRRLSGLVLGSAGRAHAWPLPGFGEQNPGQGAPRGTSRAGITPELSESPVPALLCSWGLRAAAVPWSRPSSSSSSHAEFSSGAGQGSCSPPQAFEQAGSFQQRVALLVPAPLLAKGAPKLFILLCRTSRPGQVEFLSSTSVF